MDMGVDKLQNDYRGTCDENKDGYYYRTYCFTSGSVCRAVAGTGLRV